MIGGGAVAKATGKTEEKIAMAHEAKLRLSDAVARATAKVPGTAVEAELKRKKKVVWEIEVLTSDGKLVEVDVAADTGEIVDTEPQK